MAASLVFRLHDRGPELVREVLLERGWEEYDGAARQEEDWNLYWRASAFHNSQYNKLLPWQRLNHHPQTVGITRKDCLARNLRRMKASCGSSLYDFSPAAFILPNDFTRFLAQHDKVHAGRRHRRRPPLYWICKPVDLSRGRGIFIFQEMKDLVYDCCVIVQRYISDPLLISGYKFDLRIYVCVKSFHPLTVYIHQEGLVRFATEKYDLSSLQNLYAHLTNTSINKLGPFYKTHKERVGRGCKWTMSEFRRFLHSQDVDQLLLWQRINNIVTLTLLTIAPSVPSCPNCVELLGFDVLIDAGFKPWLLEVNYSPALTLDCPADITVKKGLIGDLIDLMNYSSADGLRERAYLRQKHGRPCFHASQAAGLPLPALSKVKETRGQEKTPDLRSSQTQTLPLLRTQHHKKMNHLPPLPSYQTPAASRRLMNAMATKSQTNKSRHNLTLGPHAGTSVSVGQARAGCAAWRRRDGRRLHVSEVTNPDTAETEAEMETPGEPDVSSVIPDMRHGGLGFRRHAGSWRLPDINSGNQPVTAPPAGTSPPTGPQVPPLRVGDFIRTFPFNAATLKASQQTLDVRSIMQELQRLTARLVSGQSDMESSRREEGGGDCDSLFWGPTDPPFISQCFKPPTP